MFRRLSIILVALALTLAVGTACLASPVGTGLNKEHTIIFVDGGTGMYGFEVGFGFKPFTPALAIGPYYDYLYTDTGGAAYGYFGLFLGLATSPLDAQLKIGCDFSDNAGYQADLMLRFNLMNKPVHIAAGGGYYYATTAGVTTSSQFYVEGAVSWRALDSVAVYCRLDYYMVKGFTFDVGLAIYFS